MMLRWTTRWLTESRRDFCTKMPFFYIGTASILVLANHRSVSYKCLKIQLILIIYNTTLASLVQLGHVFYQSFNRRISTVRESSQAFFFHWRVPSRVQAFARFSATISRATRNVFSATPERNARNLNINIFVKFWIVHVWVLCHPRNNAKVLALPQGSTVHVTILVSRFYSSLTLIVVIFQHNEQIISNKKYNPAYILFLVAPTTPVVSRSLTISYF